MAVKNLIHAPGLIYDAVVTYAAANPQLQFFENFPGKNGASPNLAISNNTLSIHAVNIPLSLSFNYPTMLIFNSVGIGVRTLNASFGLYSLNGSTLSLANSASNQLTRDPAGEMIWMSLVTSATQNITPGAWYFAAILDNSTLFNVFRYFGNSSSNLGNAAPTMIYGRMTASTGAMPSSIATSNLDITGADAIRQPYIIITA